MNGGPTICSSGCWRWYEFLSLHSFEIWTRTFRNTRQFVNAYHSVKGIFEIRAAFSNRTASSSGHRVPLNAHGQAYEKHVGCPNSVVFGRIPVEFVYSLCPFLYSLSDSTGFRIQSLTITSLLQPVAIKERSKTMSKSRNEKKFRSRNCWTSDGIMSPWLPNQIMVETERNDELCWRIRTPLYPVWKIEREPVLGCQRIRDLVCATQRPFFFFRETTSESAIYNSDGSQIRKFQKRFEFHPLFHSLTMTSTLAAEPTDELFLKHHDFQNMPSLHGSVHPVFLEDGIHYQVKGELVKKLPGRTEKNVKARVQWFGVLCLAGVGMFIEAYSKCTSNL